MLKDALGFQDLTRREAAGLVEDVDALSWGFELARSLISASMFRSGW